ncbi:unnamed protein product, partial [Laminaria digitata]
DAFSCPSCEATFDVERDRQHLGLGPARPLPGQGLPEVLALHAEPASIGDGRDIASTSLAGAAPETRSPESQQGIGSDTQAHQRLEDANRLVRQWRQRASSDRQHAWAVMLIASLIAVSALAYAYLAGSAPGITDSDAEGGSVTSATNE